MGGIKLGIKEKSNKSRIQWYGSVFLILILTAVIGGTATFANADLDVYKNIHTICIQTMSSIENQGELSTHIDELNMNMGELKKLLASNSVTNSYEFAKALMHVSVTLEKVTMHENGFYTNATETRIVFGEIMEKAEEYQVFDNGYVMYDGVRISVLGVRSQIQMGISIDEITAEGIVNRNKLEETDDPETGIFIMLDKSLGPYESVDFWLGSVVELYDEKKAVAFVDYC